MTDNTQQNGGIILGVNQNGIIVSASAARISTQQGTALEIYERSTQSDKNLGLLKKVLASGHKSVIEHTVFSVAFNNVSVFAEQYIIEFRLASYTVKSRRYVDFSNEGCYVPEKIGTFGDKYNAFVKEMFEDYAKLVELGIPKEDARFVLPYGFYSNFYCTLNARELIYMIATMLWGRGSKYPELYALGAQLAEQFEQYFPGVIESEKSNYVVAEGYLPVSKKAEFSQPVSAKGYSECVSFTQNADSVLALAHTFNSATDAPLDAAFTTGQRLREYEALNLCYIIRDISLAAITHLVRHRIQTVLVPELSLAITRAKYVLPETVKQNEEALNIYTSAFSRATAVAKEFYALNGGWFELPYFALAGHTLDVYVNMDGRQFIHFINLRTCNRAQWEIRDIAKHALNVAKSVQPGIWEKIGPGCVMYGKCPEGRMTCGRAAEVIAEFKKIN